MIRKKMSRTKKACILWSRTSRKSRRSIPRYYENVHPLVKLLPKRIFFVREVLTFADFSFRGKGAWK